MKLNDVYTKPLKDVVEELDLTDMKVHTDDDGEVRSIELKYEPNNRFTKGAQAFRLAQATDKKLSTGIAAALDAKAEQLREYEKRFEPEPPEPDPLLEARTSLAQVGFSAAAATYALRRFAEALKPEPLSHLTNNWRKMHGLPMHRKPASFRRRRKGNGTGKQSK